MDHLPRVCTTFPNVRGYIVVNLPSDEEDAFRRSDTGGFPRLVENRIRVTLQLGDSLISMRAPVGFDRDHDKNERGNRSANPKRL